MGVFVCVRSVKVGNGGYICMEGDEVHYVIIFTPVTETVHREGG